MRVLVVEDSASLRRSLELGLGRAGFAVDSAATGIEALPAIRRGEPDVVVLDLMLPGLDGLEVLRRMRAEGLSAAVLILTARDALADRVTGLRAGADDYLVKPFAFDELLARIQALVRRRHGHRSPIIRIGALELDTAAKRILCAGRPVDLSPREFALLELLALKRGSVVSRAEIGARLYPEGAEPTSNAVDRTVCTLRRKLEGPGMSPILHTRRGLGYVLEEAGP